MSPREHEQGIGLEAARRGNPVAGEPASREPPVGPVEDVAKELSEARYQTALLRSILAELRDTADKQTEELKRIEMTFRQLLYPVYVLALLLLLSIGLRACGVL